MLILPVALVALQTGGRIADPVEFRKPLVALLEAKWPANRTFTIVCHGHSVPAGYFKTPIVQTFDAYPHLLHEAIKKRYPNAVVNVVVTAIGGEQSEQGAARFERDVMAMHPDVVTIDYALNDRGIGLTKARAAWSSMIEKAQKGGAKVILLTPSWDLGARPGEPGDPLGDHAAQIRDLAKKYGTGLADSFAAFIDAKRSGVDLVTLMSQSNHPNRAGHELILKGLLPWFGAP
jgi:acyl-CoA thioesterase I